jgi:hypothetical protein
MKDTISSELQLLLFRTRLAARNANKQEWEPTPRNRELTLIIQLQKWFPSCKKGKNKDEIRHKILGALTGWSVAHQKDLPYYVTETLIDITREPSRYLSVELSRELETAVTSEAYGPAWNLPVVTPESLVVQLMPQAN